MWAIGHYNPFEVRLCKRCDKEIDRRYYELVDPNLQSFDKTANEEVN